jgi:Ca2+-binding EF-hand superfamily protein
MVVIAEKLNERSKGSLAFTRMFNQFDRDKNGSIDREEFEKLLDIFNIALNDGEISVVFEHFGAEDGGIKYKPFVHTVEMQNRKHPLGGYAGSGFGQKA